MGVVPVHLSDSVVPVLLLRALCASLFSGKLRITLGRVISMVRKTGGFHPLGGRFSGLGTVCGFDNGSFRLSVITRRCVRPGSRCLILLKGAGRRTRMAVGRSKVDRAKFSPGIILSDKIRKGN